MRDELASKLLSVLMDWKPDELKVRGAELQALARFKYDDYEGFRPGEKFLESLVGWLKPFELEDRQRLVDFVLRDVVFVSRPELDHLIDTAYPQLIEPLFLAWAAEATGTPRHRVRRLRQSSTFTQLQRSTLVLGLSDGARLDRLRRSSRQLSHEQFHPSHELGEAARQTFLSKLRKGLGDEAAVFGQVLLVEDFSGTGFSLLRKDGGGWDGKLWRASAALAALQTHGVLATAPRICVLVYVASDAAIQSLSRDLVDSSLGWDSPGRRTARRCFASRFEAIGIGRGMVRSNPHDRTPRKG